MYKSAKNCSDTLLQYGLEALTSAKNHQVSEALEQVVLTIIVSTGLVSVLVINDYNSCLAHSIYYGCTMLPQGEKTSSRRTCKLWRTCNVTFR